MCNYMPLSVPVVWKLAELKSMDSPEFTKLNAVVDGLEQIESAIALEEMKMFDLYGDKMYEELDKKYKNNSFFHNLLYVTEDLASKALIYSLLRNIPDMTFQHLFKKLGPSMNDTIRYCWNAGVHCFNITELQSGVFPKCFEYDTMGGKEGSKVMDEGISQGVSMIYMNGVQFADVGVKRVQIDSGYSLLNNTFTPYSSNGMRLMINPPGVQPTMSEQGIDISPGYHTLISLTG